MDISQQYYSIMPVPSVFITKAALNFETPEAGITIIKGEISQTIQNLIEALLRPMLLGIHIQDISDKIILIRRSCKENYFFNKDGSFALMPTPMRCIVELLNDHVKQGLITRMDAIKFRPNLAYYTQLREDSSWEGL